MKMPDPQYYPSVKAAVHDTLIHCLVTLDHRLIFGVDRIDAVSRGVGRFIDPNMEQIAIDEPLCPHIDYYLSVDRKVPAPSFCNLFRGALFSTLYFLNLEL
ncbi:hypothetical protein F5146DRAFT_1071283 [Armillaria mellea]|nr:hypothetical protein F5146DRAFT_1071283 [Armillaria mellea]